MRHLIGWCAVLIVTAFAVLAARWIDEHYVVRLEPAKPSGPFHHPGYRKSADEALRRFGALTASEQAQIRESLEQSIVAADTWIASLNRSANVVLCLGEDHEDTTREFLARRVFSVLDLDAVLLEVTPEELGRTMQKLRWKRERVELLGADIAAIIRASRRRNPSVRILGIEETKAQRLARQGHGARGTRDTSIASTFWRHFHNGRRYAILFGALHCTARRNWLYGRIRHLAPRRVADVMLNVRVLEVHQDGSVEALVFLLSALGLPVMQSADAVIIRSKDVHPAIFEWFDLLAVMLEEYSYLMIFDEQRRTGDG